MLASIRKRIESCSQNCANLRMVLTNLESVQAEKEAGRDVDSQYLITVVS